MDLILTSGWTRRYAPEYSPVWFAVIGKACRVAMSSGCWSRANRWLSKKFSILDASRPDRQSSSCSESRSGARAQGPARCADPESLVTPGIAARICTTGSMVQWSFRNYGPLVIGHEVGGRVRALGKDVTGWRVGDAVAIHPATHARAWSKTNGYAPDPGRHLSGQCGHHAAHLGRAG